MHIRLSFSLSVSAPPSPHAPCKPQSQLRHAQSPSQPPSKFKFESPSDLFPHAYPTYQPSHKQNGDMPIISMTSLMRLSFSATSALVIMATEYMNEMVMKIGMFVEMI